MSHWDKLFKSIYQKISIACTSINRQCDKIWQFYEGLFCIWQKLLPTLVNSVCNWAILHGSKWANNENYKKPSGHTVNRSAKTWLCAVYLFSVQDPNTIDQSFTSMSSWISKVSSKLKRYSILSLEMLQSMTVFLLVLTMMKGSWNVEICVSKFCPKTVSSSENKFVLIL